MSDTQITYPVWNSHYDLSWLPQRTIKGLPKFASDLLIDYLDSPFLLFRIRNDVINILRDLPKNVSVRPLIEIDVSLSSSAARFLETKTGRDIYQIGRWLTNQFSSLYFHEKKLGRKIPNTVIHLWQDSDLNKVYEIYTTWNEENLIQQKSSLGLLLTRGFDAESESAELIIRRDSEKVTHFGIEELCKMLHWGSAKAVSRYPLLSEHHIEIASTISKTGLERLWVKHCAYHESWKISENTAIWESISSEAWVPILKGNVLILGRVIPVSDPSENRNAMQMVVVPGSLLLKVG